LNLKQHQTLNIALNAVLLIANAVLYAILLIVTVSDSAKEMPEAPVYGTNQIFRITFN